MGTELRDLLKSIETPSLDSLVSGDGPIYIYGAGNVGKDVCRILKRRGIAVAALLDRNAKPDAAWEGVPVRKPDDPAILAADRKNARVLIGIFNRETEIPPVMSMLNSLGYSKVTGFVDVHHALAKELGDRFWLTSRDFYASQQNEIAKAEALFTDDKSRVLFRQLICFRLTGDYTALPAPSLDDQYFPKYLPAWTSPLRMIDCGAYDGDTLRAIAERKLAVDAIAAFEPDPENFAKAVKTAHDLFPGKVTVEPYGVDSSKKEVRFASGQGSSSNISETGETVIQCASLDGALPDFRPNLIKMDIEGAEYDALLGARQLIHRHRPGLAISVYHKADHLWSIPLLAQSYLKGGRHYLRSHAFTGFELIYYWMPE